ncbi:type II toxin-antitoxin system RelE/ParE family toxin [Leptospira sp. 96542]|nr:type II toxin-antitoxin system RelE/ParE family toxin [Leptospira sp. 96542]
MILEMYSISIVPSAIKSLKKISNPYDQKVIESIQSLSLDPFPNGFKKLKGRDGYRIRVADYRVVYSVDKEKQNIIVLNLGHRKDIYS